MGEDETEGDYHIAPPGVNSQESDLVPDSSVFHGRRSCVNGITSPRSRSHIERTLEDSSVCK